MRNSFFATAKAAFPKTSIAAAKCANEAWGASGHTTPALGIVELTDAELHLVAAGSAEVSGTPHGNNSTSSDNNGQRHNKISAGPSK